MKKQMLLFRRKGFTLIECLIAIAVFGAMTMIVFMILTHARTQTVEANKSEEDLSNLIENVMGDETYKRYNKDHHEVNGEDILNLVVDGSTTGNFTISYNVIDGNKNFVQCPNLACGHYGNNTDFMLKLNGSVYEAIAKADFLQTNYVCPKCEQPFTDTLLCEDCASTGNHTDTAKFTYLPTTGGYICNNCGGTAVRHTSYSDGTATGDASMSVSGIVPNAIRYGKVVPKYDSNGNDVRPIESLFKYNNTSIGGGRILFGLKYEAAANSSVPGTYTLTIQGGGTNIPADAKDANGYYEMVIQLPPHYVVKNFTKVNGSAELSALTNGDSSGTNGVLRLRTNMNGESKFTFQLVNYKSGFSFEYDYNSTNNSEQGLAGYWFGITTSPTRDDAGYVKTWSFANKAVDCVLNP